MSAYRQSCRGQGSVAGVVHRNRATGEGDAAILERYRAGGNTGRRRNRCNGRRKGNRLPVDRRIHRRSHCSRAAGLIDGFNLGVGGAGNEVRVSAIDCADGVRTQRE